MPAMPEVPVRELNQNTAAARAPRLAGARRGRPPGWVVPLVIGVLGMLAALALPFAPVWTQQTTVSWPRPGAPVVSSTAFLVPYRPARLELTAPCSVVRAAAARGVPTTVLSTAGHGDGLLVRVADASAAVLVNGRLVTSEATVGPDCGIRVEAAPTTVTITVGDRVVVERGSPVPIVQAFRTDLAPGDAAGLAVTAQASSVFDERATIVKRTLLAVWLAAALLALGWLWRCHRAPNRASPAEVRWWRRARPRAPALVVDAGVLTVLAGWAVIGPLSDDDGFAATIARNSAAAGYQGNYYRWWNDSEAPFALAQHLLAPMTELSVSPLWLRLPSTVLAGVTWLVLSRVVLPAMLRRAGSEPGGSVSPAGFDPRSGTVRLLVAVCFLACWLPFNLGVRPEAYVALGVTAVLGLLWRARGVRALGAAALIAGVTATASPTAVLLAAPVLVLAPRVVAALRAGATGRGDIAARLAVLGCLGSVALVIAFADQSGHAVKVATRWHADFGPALSWYQELTRYQYLLGADQDGSATKRVPVLLCLALLPVIGLLVARNAEPGGPGAARLSPDTARLAGITVLGLLLLSLTPSKWTHHFGALAGLFTPLLVMSVLLLVRCGGHPGPGPGPGQPPTARDRVPAAGGLAGAGLVAVAAGVAFSGPNAWWQPAVYDVPWAAGPVAPGGVPLSSPLLWVALAVAALAVATLPMRRAGNRRAGDRLACAAVPERSVTPEGADVLERSAVPPSAVPERVAVPRPAERAAVLAPALLAVTAAAVSVAVLLVSFIAAPLRQPSGSLAISNLRTLAGRPNCGLGEDVVVLPDVPDSVMIPAGPTLADARGFTEGAGFDPTAPPPDPPGTGASALLWGSRGTGPTGTGTGDTGPEGTGTLTTPWFTLPHLTTGQEVTVSVAGRTDSGNALAVELGRSAPSGSVTVLGARTPPDPLRSQPDTPPEYQLWRAVGVPADQIPAGADRVRIHAVDATSRPEGWLAVTGPRLRAPVSLRDFLAAHGPTLVAWPIALLVPCAANLVAVRDGLAQAPATVLEAPQRYADLAAATTDPVIGGSFAGLRALGQLGEVTTRLRGHPGVDWGDLLLATYPAARDNYAVRTTWTRTPGIH